jgi:hypothetical protein
MIDTIYKVLSDPQDTSLQTAQFRFWTKRMFSISETGLVCHEKRPVAPKEQIYGILVMVSTGPAKRLCCEADYLVSAQSHGASAHGGRDKTSLHVRRSYSWVPKELIARFVKCCPLCNARRSSNRSYFTNDNGANYPQLDPNDNPELGHSAADSSAESTSLHHDHPWPKAEPADCSLHHLPLDSSSHYSYQTALASSSSTSLTDSTVATPVDQQQQHYSPMQAPGAVPSFVYANDLQHGFSSYSEQEPCVLSSGSGGIRRHKPPPPPLDLRSASADLLPPEAHLYSAHYPPPPPSYAASHPYHHHQQQAQHVYYHHGLPSPAPSHSSAPPSATYASAEYTYGPGPVTAQLPTTTTCDYHPLTPLSATFEHSPYLGPAVEAIPTALPSQFSRSVETFFHNPCPT